MGWVVCFHATLLYRSSPTPKFGWVESSVGVYLVVHAKGYQFLIMNLAVLSVCSLRMVSCSLCLFIQDGLAVLSVCSLRMV